MSKMQALRGEYYSACHAVFRQATNQGNLMLEETMRILNGKDDLAIASVGSGTGLFEIPLLQNLNGQNQLKRFVGIDIDKYACKVLESRLRAEFDGKLNFEVHNGHYEDFPGPENLDVILFNHTLEYVIGDPVPWIRKALASRSARGSVLIFSPDRGGINQIYEETATSFNGTPPLFSDGIENALVKSRIAFTAKNLSGVCNTELLEQGVEDEKRIMLLSFLTHVDCRAVSDIELESFVNYYLSQRKLGTASIPHPTTLFVI